MGDSRTIMIRIDADGKAAIVNMDKVADEGETSAKRLTKAFSALDIKSSLDIEKEKNRLIAAFDLIKNSGSASASDVSRAYAAMHSKLDKLSGIEGSTAGATKGMRNFDTAIGATSASMLKMAAAWTAGSIGITAITQQLLAAGMAAEKLRNGFEVAMGGATAGANAMAFVRGEAERLGLDLQSAAQAYLKLAASAKGTVLEGHKTEQVFSAVAGAGRSLGLSADEVDGALLAISQMMSKGVVSAEELRGQLGERLPGAFQVAARSMGVSTAELGKMLEQGQVIADDFLPKFAAELQKTFPPGEEAMAGLTAETGRLKKAWYELKEVVMKDAGGETFFTHAIRALKETIQETIIDVQQIAHPFTPRNAFTKPVPLNSFDADVLGLGGSIGVDTSGTDWLFKNSRITPFLTPQQIDATGPVVKDRSLMPVAPVKTPTGSATTKQEGLSAAQQEKAWLDQESAWITKQLATQYREEEAAAARESAEWRKAELDDLREKLRYADELAQKTYDASAFGGMMNGLDDYAQHALNVGENIRDAVGYSFQAMEDSLVSFVQTGKLSFSSLANSIIDDLVRIAVQSSITGPLSAAFKGMFSASPATAPATFFFHDGGLVQRYHDGGLIPRYHFGGLAADEVPAILQTGERVLDREHNALLERFASKAAAPTTLKLELINQTSREVQVEQGQSRFDGESWVVQAVIKDFKNGGPTRSLFSGGGNY